MSYLCFGLRARRRKWKKIVNLKLLVYNRMIYRTDHQAFLPITTTPFLLDFFNRLFIHCLI